MAKVDLERLRAALDAVRARCDVAVRVDADPVSIVHRFDAPEARELVAVIASSLAFGNAKAFRVKIDDALDRLGPDVVKTADDPALVSARLRGWKHRVYTGADLASLVVGTRSLQRREGSLGEAFAKELLRTKDLREALAAFTQAIREAGAFSSSRRGAAHILADPMKGSASKRLLLLLRWMVRPSDGIDLGAWPVDPSVLLIPVDTHIHKLSRNLGITDRKDVSWRTAEEITAVLRRFDASDPVKYDFSLCHLGMLQRCPSRRDPKRCEGCGVIDVCRHWQEAPSARANKARTTARTR